ncbi:MAG: type II toxin-antitoxin system RelE/ParE family toxin [Planctomycetes bacterium]|nr:type II toxin-antitoxin system RelE/ParE family toxin [Planctomycetota bacterium]
MRIVVSPLAQRDLDEAYRHISLDSPDAADRVLAQITETVGLLASGLVIGSQTTLRDGRRVRSWSMPPYRIYYRVNADELDVVRVYHMARRPIERRHR